MTFNKIKREIPSGIFTIKIHENLNKNNRLNKNGKLLSIIKSEVNNILREKYDKPLKIKKVFYLNEEAKEKRMDFCKKIVEMKLGWKKLEGLNIFLKDKTRINKILLVYDYGLLTK